MNKRLARIEATMIILFMVSLVFCTINKDFVQIIPNEIAGYLFWLSLGLWLGFQIYKQELKRIYKKQQQQQEEQEKKENPPLHSVK